MDQAPLDQHFQSTIVSSPGSASSGSSGYSGPNILNDVDVTPRLGPASLVNVDVEPADLRSQSASSTFHSASDISILNEVDVTPRLASASLTAFHPAVDAGLLTAVANTGPPPGNLTLDDIVRQLPSLNADTPEFAMNHVSSLSFPTHVGSVSHLTVHAGRSPSWRSTGSSSVLSPAYPGRQATIAALNTSLEQTIDQLQAITELYLSHNNQDLLRFYEERRLAQQHRTAQTLLALSEYMHLANEQQQQSAFPAVGNLAMLSASVWNTGRANPVHLGSSFINNITDPAAAGFRPEIVNTVSRPARAGVAYCPPANGSQARFASPNVESHFLQPTSSYYPPGQHVPESGSISNGPLDSSYAPGLTGMRPLQPHAAAQVDSLEYYQPGSYYPPAPYPVLAPVSDQDIGDRSLPSIRDPSVGLVQSDAAGTALPNASAGSHLLSSISQPQGNQADRFSALTVSERPLTDVHDEEDNGSEDEEMTNGDDPNKGSSMDSPVPMAGFDNPFGQCMMCHARGPNQRCTLPRPPWHWGFQMYACTVCTGYGLPKCSNLPGLFDEDEDEDEQA
ncbi:hypothetical protein S40285_09814 [Stachybotrys chlorohalonatus IBT 40285]|uniref:Uncharacterized protein n=1 Tax=Stachybotrys chlorohalonatus (strain IBT 40285) TaxID=1283841 RepID=A0A084QZ41_STAC4|nr:hypothetical protein S40285_09814 [Stachybotrys chlorohalonata IBT 40285]